MKSLHFFVLSMLLFLESIILPQEAFARSKEFEVVSPKEDKSKCVKNLNGVISSLLTEEELYGMRKKAPVFQYRKNILDFFNDFDERVIPYVKKFSYYLSEDKKANPDKTFEERVFSFLKENNDYILNLTKLIKKGASEKMDSFLANEWKLYLTKRQQEFLVTNEQYVETAVKAIFYSSDGNLKQFIKRIETPSSFVRPKESISNIDRRVESFFMWRHKLSDLDLRTLVAIVAILSIIALAVMEVLPSFFGAANSLPVEAK